ELADDPAAANDEYRPRFRSPVLKGYDPGRFADGSWESHFYMAPNVRFTRTPDKASVRTEEPAVEPPPPAEPAAPVLPSESDLLERLREALDERRRRFEMQQAVPVAPTPAAVAEPPATAPAPAEPA